MIRWRRKGKEARGKAGRHRKVRRGRRREGRWAGRQAGRGMSNVPHDPTDGDGAGAAAAIMFYAPRAFLPRQSERGARVAPPKEPARAAMRYAPRARVFALVAGVVTVVVARTARRRRRAFKRERHANVGGKEAQQAKNTKVEE